MKTLSWTYTCNNRTYHIKYINHGKLFLNDEIIRLRGKNSENILPIEGCDARFIAHGNNSDVVIDGISLTTKKEYEGPTQKTINFNLIVSVFCLFSAYSGRLYGWLLGVAGMLFCMFINRKMKLASKEKRCKIACISVCALVYIITLCLMLLL